jgi:hypothetical protein
MRVPYCLFSDERAEAGDGDGREGNSLQWSSIMAAAITATIAMTMTATCSGLLVMCLKKAKRVPTGISFMPHFGQAPASC